MHNILYTFVSTLSRIASEEKCRFKIVCFQTRARLYISKCYIFKKGSLEIRLLAIHLARHGLLTLILVMWSASFPGSALFRPLRAE